jgi:putative hydrolase of the HAD superfamily
LTAKPQLILDIGGVLATNFSPLFWQELSATSGIPYDKIVDYKKDIREKLWSGKITEEEFWTRLCVQFPSIEKAKAQVMLRSHIKPLPAMEEVPAWSRLADIHLVSNHRIEWIKPILNSIQDYVKSITISSQVGSCKPHPSIYAKVTSHLIPETYILYIDDQEKNFNEAHNLGWHTLLADEKGDWIQQVMPLLLEKI